MQNHVHPILTRQTHEGVTAIELGVPASAAAEHVWKPRMSNAPDRSAKRECAPPEIARARTLPEIFNARAALTPKLLAYREYDARRQSWVDWTWGAVAAEVARWRRAFAGERFPAGSRIGVLMASGITVMGWTAPRTASACQDGRCHQPI